MERALIIDDDQLIHYAISKTLKADCAEVKMVSRGTDILHEISSSSYDLCFFNIALPGLDSIDILKRIKELSPGTKIIAMTGSYADDTVQEEVEKHSYYLLSKPFDISELKAVASQALGKAMEKATTERRRAQRTPSSATVAYSITTLEFGRPTTLSLKGELVDISDVGAGIRTYYPLEPGQIVVLALEAKQAQFRTGIVRRSVKVDNNCVHRVGIEFIES